MALAKMRRKIGEGRAPEQGRSWRTRPCRADAGLMSGLDAVGWLLASRFILQANVEHLTDKMKTDIQRGLVLR